jgi:Mg-chelatase subunit ChlD
VTNMWRWGGFVGLAIGAMVSFPNGFASNALSGTAESAWLPSELVFVTEDLPAIGNGCEAITSVGLSDDGPRVIHRGRPLQSPGRLSANSNLSIVIASPNNTRLQPPQTDESPPGTRDLYVSRVRDDSGARDEWAIVTSPRVLHMGGIVVTRDNHLLVGSWSSGITRRMRDGPWPAYGIAQFTLNEVETQQHIVATNTVTTEGGVVELLLSTDHSLVHALEVAVDWRTRDLVPRVSTYRVSDLTMVGAPIPIAPIGEMPMSCESVSRFPAGIAHAALSPDGRYLVVNTWSSCELSVVDLQLRRTWTLCAESLSHTAGVAFNHASRSSDMQLAVHGLDALATYSWNGDQLELLSTQPVEPIVSVDDSFLHWGPIGSVAWSANGRQLIAAGSASGQDEFTVWDVTDDGRIVGFNGSFEGCPGGRSNYPNDILTGNGILPTATVTPSPSALPTSTATSTSTATDEPTATSATAAVFLPVVLNEECVPGQRRLDVIVALDASTSMREHTAIGETKWASAKAAAASFIEVLNFTEGDQAGLVVFSSEAHLVQPLTSVEFEFRQALDAVTLSLGTCLVCAVDVADTELLSERRDGANLPVIILLTDGLSNPRPASEAVERALAPKARGVVIFTIGVGDFLDFDALRAVASQAEYFYHSPDGTDLETIYRAVATAIPCPSDVFWPSRP